MSIRRIILSRHGEAEFSASSGLSDHDRGLTEHGRVQCEALGKLLSGLDWKPRVVFCSDAKRTKETASIIDNLWLKGAEIRYDPKLYLASLEYVQKIISEQSDDTDALMFIGHNPGLSQVVEAMSFSPVGLTTAGTVVLSKSLDSWQEALFSAWDIEFKHLQ